jgi:hypothetical protein
MISPSFSTSVLLQQQKTLKIILSKREELALLRRNSGLKRNSEQLIENKGILRSTETLAESQFLLLLEIQLRVLV